VPSRQDGPVARLTPLRILVVSRDRHFRTIASLLLARRNCSVTTTANAARLTELVARDAADVVVIDASELPAATMVAKVKALAQTVGIVLVSNGAGTPRSDPPVFAKWGPFEDLAAAIEHAAARRGIGSA
jgi:CheY-like chemotaxis protein